MPKFTGSAVWLEPKPACGTAPHSGHVTLAKFLISQTSGFLTWKACVITVVFVAWAAITKYHKLSGLNNRDTFHGGG